MIPVLSKEEKPVVSGTTGLSVSADVKEVIAFCPSCKALETLWPRRRKFVNGFE